MTRQGEEHRIRDGATIHNHRSFGDHAGNSDLRDECEDLLAPREVGATKGSNRYFVCNIDIHATVGTHWHRAINA